MTEDEAGVLFNEGEHSFMRMCFIYLEVSVQIGCIRYIVYDSRKEKEFGENIEIDP